MSHPGRARAFGLELGDRRREYRVLVGADHPRITVMTGDRSIPAGNRFADALVKRVVMKKPRVSPFLVTAR